MGDLKFPGRYAGTKQLLVGTTQPLGTAWANLGGTLDVQGANYVGLAAVYDIGTDTDIRIRLRVAIQSGGQLFNLPIRTVAASVVQVEPEYVELNTDADQALALSWDLDALYPYIQFQACVGSASGTPAAISTAIVTTGMS